MTSRGCGCREGALCEVHEAERVEYARKRRREKQRARQAVWLEKNLERNRAAAREGMRRLRAERRCAQQAEGG